MGDSIGYTALMPSGVACGSSQVWAWAAPSPSTLPSPQILPRQGQGEDGGHHVTGFMIGPALAGIISIFATPAFGWRVVLFFALLPLIFIPFLCAYLPESVRFLARNGRYDQV